ncbi:hypothetical protein CFAM422_007359 [Trichoderma lentiforme]|uniref:Uncharacterized protein n=1 Tax=Trichoderma lentiforme TaxID=1567552 RepID=A0A9P5CAM4_9HYPO|nr:hypothetical protein CFAM422_007359 [Trichoderma lentiforme]
MCERQRDETRRDKPTAPRRAASRANKQLSRPVRHLAYAPACSGFGFDFDPHVLPPTKAMAEGLCCTEYDEQCCVERAKRSPSPPWDRHRDQASWVSPTAGGRRLRPRKAAASTRS